MSDEPVISEETENPNLLGALVFSFGAALISALIWFGAVVLSGYQLGIVAVAVGWIVAQAAIFGAGRKRGGTVQIISVLATLFSVILSEYLIDRHFVVEYLTSEGYTDIPWVFPLDLSIGMIVDGIKAEPTTLLFWLIALYEAFIIPKAPKIAS